MRKNTVCLNGTKHTTPTQRLEALESFRHGLSGVLVCTDLAARGLDIPAVSTVLHFDMPKRIKGTLLPRPFPFVL